MMIVCPSHRSVQLALMLVSLSTLASAAPRPPSRETSCAVYAPNGDAASAVIENGSLLVEIDREGSVITLKTPAQSTPRREGM